MHASRTPNPVDYAPWILSEDISLGAVVILGESDKCYQFKTFALLMYSRGVSPKDSLKPNDVMMSRGICLHNLILVSQSVSQPANQHSAIRLGHTPHRLHKPRDTPGFLHSDSDQQKDNINRTQPLASSACSIKQHSTTHFICVLSSASKVRVHLSSMHVDLHTALLTLAIIFLLFFFQMAAFNFDHILLMLAEQGSILWDTLQSQDGLNLGDICFCPIGQTLRMQRISLERLQKLITEGMFMPPPLEGPSELSRTTAFLLVFQVDGQHERITDVYMGLLVHRVESRLYTPDWILDFVKDIEVNLKVACHALKARGNPGKKRAFCLFISNYGDAMSVPTDPPYCLIYPTSNVRDMELDHFNTHNNPAGTCLHRCICCATLQYMNDDPNQRREYSRSHLILPCWAQYKE